MKILMGDFNANGGKEDIFKLIRCNESPHEGSNGNGVRVVNFETLKNLIFKSTKFPHRDIHKHTSTSLMMSNIIRSGLDRQNTTFKYIRCLLLQKS
jgi:hypothetical protein